MKKLLQSYSIVLSLGFTVLLFASFYQKEQKIDSSTSSEPGILTTNGTLPQVITSIDLTRDYTFAGESVPKENFDALERLDRELSVNSYLHSSTLLNLKASQRFFQIIEPILAKHGIPEDFKYIAVVESNLRNETSPAGAKGIWQFVKPTGEYYGLEINDEIDERNHLEKSTEAACKYLKDYYSQFGSWAIAAAAYNMGGPRMKKLLEEQKVQSYYDLNLNSETSRYVFRVIAIKEIMEHPTTFGFYIADEDLYRPLNYEVVSVEGPVENWAEFAITHGTNYRMLKVFNPWIITSSLNNKMSKKYEVKIPVKK
jgi:hypothetical protein